MDKNFLRLPQGHEVIRKTPDVKILFLGARNVGKTALAVRFLTRRFIGEYDNSSDASYCRQITINAQECAIEMLDPQTEPSSTKNARGKIDWADAVILVYSVTSKKSFREAISLKQTIEKSQQQSKRMPIVLMANKIDLTHMRSVWREEGQTMAAKWGCSYYECSAAVFSNGYNTICGAIVELCQEVLQNKAASKAASRMGRRRASLSPRPFRDAIFKMFGTTKDDILTCKNTDL
eukprot:gene204-818_t